MLAAHLRGLLRPSNDKYGIVSMISESVTLEILAASIAAEDYTSSALATCIKLPLMSEKDLATSAASVSARLQRANELRFAAIFSNEEGKPKDGSMSLFQLYQLAQKSGVLAALADYNPPTRPLLR